jgi:hypothetical protein
VAFIREQEFPREIVNLPQLRELNLSDNELTTLPPNVGDMTTLRHLYLHMVRTHRSRPHSRTSSGLVSCSL